MINRNKIILIIGLILMIIFSIILRTDSRKSYSSKLQVTTSFYPLYFFASEIGGDKVEVTNITPAGAEPHDYEPTTQDIIKIENSDILIINGGGFESWADKINDNLNNKAIIFVAAGEGLFNQTNDPHIWLDPVLADTEALKISQSLEKADPINIVYYQTNYLKLKEKLNSLNQDFQIALQNCRQNNIITSHEAFGYLAARYNLKQTAISGISPDEEPSPQKLAETAQFAKINNIKYIFFETLLSPRLAETLANEIGIKTLVFNPLEGLTKEEQTAGKNYLSIQQDNLQNLKIALECK